MLFGTQLLEVFSGRTPHKLPGGDWGMMKPLTGRCHDVGVQEVDLLRADNRK